MQHARGFIVGCANRWLWSPGRQSTANSKLGKLFICKKPYYQHITYGLQSDWLHVCKAILLVQTLRATCLQSNPISTNFAGFCSNLKQFYWYKRRGLLFKLRRPLAFQLSRGLLLGAYWLAGSRSPDGGGESYHFMGNRNPSPGCLPAPAPATPHNKAYFSASKPTRKISDTWIIDTGKRETRYWLVKIHQIIWQPHTFWVILWYRQVWKK